MAQLMPLPLTVSCFSKIQIGFTVPFWYRLTRVVPEKGPLNGCVCVWNKCIFGIYFASLVQIHTHTRLTALFSGLPGWAGTRKVKTNLDFTEARDSEWQWHQLGHMQVCTLLQTDNHARTPPLSFLQTVCPSFRPTNSIKALKAFILFHVRCVDGLRSQKNKYTEGKVFGTVAAGLFDCCHCTPNRCVLIHQTRLEHCT